MGLRALVRWNVWGLRLARFWAALRKESTMGDYDWKVTLWKGLRALLGGYGALALAALGEYLRNPVGLNDALAAAGWSPTLIAAAVPVLLAIGAMIRNAAKHAPLPGER